MFLLCLNCCMSTYNGFTWLSLSARLCLISLLSYLIFSSFSFSSFSFSLSSISFFSSSAFFSLSSVSMALIFSCQVRSTSFLYPSNSLI